MFFVFVFVNDFDGFMGFFDVKGKGILSLLFCLCSFCLYFLVGVMENDNKRWNSLVLWSGLKKQNMDPCSINPTIALTTNLIKQNHEQLLKGTY
jgi:hypothetical protein